jgi:hypothetical protein
MTGNSRPIPATGLHEIIALKRPFSACGKLRAMTMEPSRIARSALMLLDKTVPPIRRIRSLLNN